MLPWLWSRSGDPMKRCTICCRCFGLEAVPQFQDVRFVAVALVSKLCPNAKIYDLLPLLWSRSGAPMLRCTICCRCFGLEMVPRLNSKMYDLLPLLWFRSGAPMLRLRFVAAKWCPIAKMYDLLPLLWSRSVAPMLKMYDLLPLLWSRSGAPMPRCTIR